LGLGSTVLSAPVLTHVQSVQQHQVSKISCGSVSTAFITGSFLAIVLRHCCSHSDPPHSLTTQTRFWPVVHVWLHFPRPGLLANTGFIRITCQGARYRSGQEPLCSHHVRHDRQLNIDSIDICRTLISDALQSACANMGSITCRSSWVAGSMSTHKRCTTRLWCYLHCCLSLEPHTHIHTQQTLAKTPTIVPFFDELHATAAFAGSEQSAILTDRGHIFVWGSLTADSAEGAPVLMALDGVSNVVLGESSRLIIANDTLYAAGSGETGRTT
jgi:hypothetical protein